MRKLWGTLTLAAAVVAAVASAPQAHAITFAGSATGTFNDPTGVPVPSVGAGTNALVLGDVTGGATPDAVFFAGTSFSGSAGDNLLLGTLNYTNGTATWNGNVNTVLDIPLTFTSPAGTASQTLSPRLLISDGSIFSPNATEPLFDVSGTNYRLQFLGFQSGNTGIGSSISLAEGATGTFNVYGRIIQVGGGNPNGNPGGGTGTPPPVPEPAAMGLLVVGLAGLAAKYRRRA